MTIYGTDVGLGEVTFNWYHHLLLDGSNYRSIDVDISRRGFDMDISRGLVLNNRLLRGVDVSRRGSDGDDLLRLFDNEYLFSLLGSVIL